MRDHRRILEQGIEIAAIRRHGEQSIEWVRVSKHESRKRADHGHHAQDARDYFVRQVFAEQRHATIQIVSMKVQSRASLVRSPGCGQTIVQRQLGVRVLATFKTEKSFVIK